jgi:hAT family C-terminal dimerisation region
VELASQKVEGDDQTEPWLDNAKQAVRELWDKEYNRRYRTATHQDGSCEDRSDVSQFMDYDSVETPAGDLYQDYIECDPVAKLSREEVLNYWNSRLLSQSDLAHFALDMLALPASSAECERVFSSSKLLITSVRNRLNPDLVEINECLKAWFSKESKEERELEERRIFGRGTRLGG